jgi:hypothetical protein
MNAHALSWASFARGDADTLEALQNHLIAKHVAFYLSEQSGVYIFDPDDKIGATLTAPHVIGSTLRCIGAVSFIGQNGATLLPSPAKDLELGNRILARRRRFPELRAVVYDYFNMTGGIGSPYDFTTRTLYVDPPLIHDYLPDDHHDRAGHYPHLRRWLSGVPFQSPADLGNLLTFAILALVRSSLSDFPLLVLDSHTKSAGKTRIGNALHYLLHGRDAEPITFAANEDKMEFQLANYCNLIGPRAILIDNIRPKRGQRGQIRSMAFSSAANHTTISLAPKCRPKQPLFAPVLICTMNGARLEPDLRDKCLLVRLRGGSPGRPQYFHPDPLDFVRHHRALLLGEIVHLSTTLCSPPPLRSPATRFKRYEALALNYAAWLGLECNLRLGDQSYDAAALEFVALHGASHTESPTLSNLTHNLIGAAGRDLHELREAVHNFAAASDDQRAAAFGDYLRQNILGRCILSNGNPLYFELDGEKVVKMSEPA